MCTIPSTHNTFDDRSFAAVEQSPIGLQDLSDREFKRQLETFSFN